MIKSNELREGNKVISTTHNLLNATVQNIMPHSGIVTLREVSTYDAFDKLEPIPLTPEWLKSFGFITLDAETDIEVWGLDDNLNGEEFSIVSDGLDTPLPLYFEYDLGYRNVRKEIKSVHQLQNLYFALTGEELTIKL